MNAIEKLRAMGKLPPPPRELMQCSPYARTRADWQARPRPYSLRHYEDVHKRQGFLFSTPEFYVMGRPVRKYAPMEQILDVEHVFATGTCDCWYVFLMAGDTRKAWSILPYELPWMCWQRDNDPLDELRFYETRRLMRLSGLDISETP